jgi:rubrerythrin
MVKRIVNPIKDIAKSLQAASAPIIKNLTAGHKRGMRVTREVLGLFVCKKCGYHQPEPFGVCPKCGMPRAGLYVPKKK